MGTGSNLSSPRVADCEQLSPGFMVSRRQNQVKYKQEKIEMKKILEFQDLREVGKNWYFGIL